MKTRIASIILFMLACACVAFTVVPTQSSTPAVPSTSALAVWRTDLQSAVRDAQARGVPVLAWFSGDGWNTASDAVAPVLRDADFVAAASGRAVLVNLSFPGAQNTESAGQRSTAFAVRFGVTELPALVVLDSDGRPFAPIDPTRSADDILAAMDRAIADKSRFDAYVASAGDLSTHEKLRQLDAAMEMVKPYATDWYAEHLDRIMRCPLADGAEIRSKWVPITAEGRIDRIMQQEIYPLADAGRFDQAIARVDAVLTGTPMSTSQRQLLTTVKGQLHFSMNDTAGAMTVLEAALALDPTGPNADRVRAARERIAEPQD